MKKHFRYPILIILTLLATISLVPVQAQPQAIGTTAQLNPYESNPTAHVIFNVGAPTTPGDMRDGSLTTSGDFVMGDVRNVTTSIKPSADVIINQGWVTAPTAGLQHWDMVNDWPGKDDDASYVKYAPTETLKSPTNYTHVGTGWTNPTYAYADDANYATAGATGRTTNYGGYGISYISGSAAVGKIEVGYLASTSTSSTSNGITLKVSVDGGSTFPFSVTKVSLPTSMPTTVTYVEVTGITWDATKVSGGKFYVQLISVWTSGTISVDWLPVRVTYSVGAADVYDLEDLPAEPLGGVTRVVLRAYAKKASGTTTVKFKFGVRLGGTWTNSSDSTLSTFYAGYVLSLDTKPGGGGWTWTDVNNLQAGVIGSTGIGSTYWVGVTQLFVEVYTGNGYFELKSFKNTPPVAYNIGFVDLKIKYNVATDLTDDSYNISYTVGTGNPWISLESYVSTKYDGVGNPAVRPWSQVANPLGGSWSWADIGNLRIRIGVKRGGTAWDGQSMYIYEVWASVYPLPLPPTGSAHLAVIPSKVYNVDANQYIFVDIYVTGVVNMTGYYLLLLFDNETLTPDSVFIYDPFHYEEAKPPELNDTTGWVILQQSRAAGIPSFTGSEPIARIYFTVDQRGTSKLDIINSTEFAGYPTGYFPIGVTESKIRCLWWVSGGLQVVYPPYTDHDGWVSCTHVLSAVNNFTDNTPTTVDLTSFNETRWRELYPTYWAQWQIVSWEDTDSDGYLSYCDQIDMLNETNWRHWFHVDVVTITIHWSNTTTGYEKSGIAEPVPPRTLMGTGTPVGTNWHELYPTYSRRFTITSWDDTGTISGTFDPSDNFDFGYPDENDIVLVGTTPPDNSPLTAPGGTNLYYDTNTNYDWDVGEPAIDDITEPYGTYNAGDTLLAGTDPGYGVTLSVPDTHDKFYDANADTDWDVGEPAIRDIDPSDIFNPRYWAHLDYVSTDILVSQKDMPPEEVIIVPEFPLGIEILMAITPMIPIIYLWRKHPKKRA